MIDANQAGDASYRPRRRRSSRSPSAWRRRRSASAPRRRCGANVGDPTTWSPRRRAPGSPSPSRSTRAAPASARSRLDGVVRRRRQRASIDANQAGDATYKAAPQAQQSFAVDGPARQSVQSITFTSDGALGGGRRRAATRWRRPRAPACRSCSPSTPAARACAPRRLDRLVHRAPARARSTRTSRATPTTAAPQVQQSFAVGLAAQTISFTSRPPGGATVGGATYTVTATASSGLAVTFAIAPRAQASAPRGLDRVVHGAGTCTIRANQAGDATTAAPQAQQSFAVANAAPSRACRRSSSPRLRRPEPSSAGQTYTVDGDRELRPRRRASRARGERRVCTLAGTTVSLVGAGTCTIDANQSGNGSYQAAPQVQQSFADQPALQTIAFASSPPGERVRRRAAYTVSATATSGLPVTFALGGPRRCCTISGLDTSRSSAPGRVSITANQAGNANYRAAPQVQQSFPCRGSQTITFTSTPPNADKARPALHGDGHGHSGLAVIFTVDPSSAGVCSDRRLHRLVPAAAPASSTPTSPATPTGCRRRRCSRCSGEESHARLGPAPVPRPGDGRTPGYRCRCTLSERTGHSMTTLRSHQGACRQAAGHPVRRHALPAHGGAHGGGRDDARPQRDTAASGSRTRRRSPEEHASARRASARCARTCASRRASSRRRSRLQRAVVTQNEGGSQRIAAAPSRPDCARRAFRRPALPAPTHRDDRDDQVGDACPGNDHRRAAAR